MLHGCHSADRRLPSDWGYRTQRLPEIKYLFVLGVNEGVLPSPATAQGIFTEAERDLLTAQGVELASGGKQKSSRSNSSSIAA